MKEPYSFHVDTRDQHDVHAVQDVRTVLAAELLDHDQRALTGGGLWSAKNTERFNAKYGMNKNE